MGKLIFAVIRLVVGLGILGGLRRRSDLLPPALRSVVLSLLLALAVVPPALILTFSVFRVIPAGQVGVKVLFGEVETAPLREGLNVAWNPLYDVVIMDTRVRFDAAYEKAVEGKGDAETAYNAKVASSLTPSLIHQQYLSRWDPRLPQYSLGANAVPFVQIPGEGKR